MLISAPSTRYVSLGESVSLYCFRCHAEPTMCSTSCGTLGSCTRRNFECQKVSEYTGLSFHGENTFLGSTRFHWLFKRRDFCVSQVPVAADYSDSVPDSPSNVTQDGYHPLEEVREHGRVRDKMLTYAEMARTTVEANDKALLVFPSNVHSEPHEQITWAEFQYAIDDFGDIIFEIFDKQNILQDHEGSNPVTALIGMDISHYESKTMGPFHENSLEADTTDESSFLDDYFEIEDSSMGDVSVDWGTPETSMSTHPVYFAKCLTKAVYAEHAKLMNHPSNGVAVWGILNPAPIDEVFYLRELLNEEKASDYSSDGKDKDTIPLSLSEDEIYGKSTIYRLEIMRIELFSIYGVQSVVGVQDYQYAEPDVLVHSISSIIERFGGKGTKSTAALKALCRKKGLSVEGANLIGVDSLGMDVRVSNGTELRTHRFSFKSKATSECSADKQIRQLLFSRSRRKKFKNS